MNLVDVVEKLHANPNAKNILAFRTGDTVEVAVRIKEAPWSNEWSLPRP